MLSTILELGLLSTVTVTITVCRGVTPCGCQIGLTTLKVRNSCKIWYLSTKLHCFTAVFISSYDAIQLRY